jgi:hypothetical protein
MTAHIFKNSEWPYLLKVITWKLLNLNNLMESFQYSKPHYLKNEICSKITFLKIFTTILCYSIYLIKYSVKTVVKFDI